MKVCNHRKPMRGAVALLALIASLGLVAAGCGGGSDEAPSATESPATETADTGAAATTAAPETEAPAEPQSDVVIGSAHPILAGQPDQEALLLGQEKGAELYGWTVKPLDAQLSTDKQVADIDTFITEGVQGITSFALDPAAMEPAFERAAAAGIPVVGFNSEAPSVNTVIKQSVFWTCESTEDAAAFIAGIKPNGKVLVMGGAPVPVLNFVVECFEKAAEAAGLTVLDRQDNVKDAPGPAQPIAADLLTRHPDVDAFWTLGDTTAAGVYAALQAAGLGVMTKDQDGVLLVANCCGGTPSADAISAGRLSAVYDTQSVEAGAAAIGALKTVLVDGKSPADMPKEILIPTVRYDFDNIDTYVPYPDRDLTQYAEGNF